MTWEGVIIEESLEHKKLLDTVKVTGSRKSFLEKEEEKGAMNFHQIAVDDSQKDKFVASAKNAIKQGWYIHICKDGKMIIIFKGKSFEFGEDNKAEIEEAKEYGESIGIHPAQMDFEYLINHPLD